MKIYMKIYNQTNLVIKHISMLQVLSLNSLNHGLHGPFAAKFVLFLSFWVKLPNHFPFSYPAGSSSFSV